MIWTLEPRECNSNQHSVGGRFAILQLQRCGVVCENSNVSIGRVLIDQENFNLQTVFGQSRPWDSAAWRRQIKHRTLKWCTDPYNWRVQENVYNWTISCIFFAWHELLSWHMFWRSFCSWTTCAQNGLPRNILYKPGCDWLTDWHQEFQNNHWMWTSPKFKFSYQ